MTNTDTDTELPFTAIDRDRYFEDYTAGKTYLLGEVAIDETEMVDYARQFDPQDIHIDQSRAGAGPFGGLIASGWYTGSLAMRLYVQHYLSNVSSLASPGFDGLTWNAPVRGGDVLRVEVSILEARRSKSKPDRGVVRTLIDVANQDGTTVMTINAINMIACRDG